MLKMAYERRRQKKACPPRKISVKDNFDSIILGGKTPTFSSDESPSLNHTGSVQKGPWSLRNSRNPSAKYDSPSLFSDGTSNNGSSVFSPCLFDSGENKTRGKTQGKLKTVKPKPLGDNNSRFKSKKTTVPKLKRKPARNQSESENEEKMPDFTSFDDYDLCIEENKDVKTDVNKEKCSTSTPLLFQKARGRKNSSLSDEENVFNVSQIEKEEEHCYVMSDYEDESCLYSVAANDSVTVRRKEPFKKNKISLALSYETSLEQEEAISICDEEESLSTHEEYNLSDEHMERLTHSVEHINITSASLRSAKKASRYLNNSESLFESFSITEEEDEVCTDSENVRELVIIEEDEEEEEESEYELSIETTNNNEHDINTATQTNQCVQSESEKAESRSEEKSMSTVSIIDGPSFYDKLSNSSICHLEPASAEDKILQLCCQDDHETFSFCIPPKMMSKCVKIGEGVFGEVFRSVSSNGVDVALKIMPVEGDLVVNDCPQKKFEEILPEMVIATELSDLASGSFNQCENFCQVNRISSVKGNFPDHLMREWDAYAKRKVSENDRPDQYDNNQLFAVFEFVNGGCALENFKFSNHKEGLSVLHQVIFALAVAEDAMEFEHRDLHIGNVLIRKTTQEKIGVKLFGQQYELNTEGVFATIIDFTYSRLKKDGCAVFCDMGTDEEMFTGEGDIQFDVYRDMRTLNGNDWEKFEPRTNILWVNYLCDKLLNSTKYAQTGRGYREALRTLRHLKEKILDYNSCMELLSNIEDLFS